MKGISPPKNNQGIVIGSPWHQLLRSPVRSGGGISRARKEKTDTFQGLEAIGIGEWGFSRPHIHQKGNGSVVAVDLQGGIKNEWGMPEGELMLSRSAGKSHWRRIRNEGKRGRGKHEVMGMRGRLRRKPTGEKGNAFQLKGGKQEDVGEDLRIVMPQQPQSKGDDERGY